MNILDNLIEFENENTSLDFKLEEYTRYKTISLIKDIMSMANADLQGDRYIIIGMKPDPVGRNIVGIDTLIDSASIQQTIIDNIEPEIHLDYFAHHYEGKLLGIIKITKCENRPYLMKKDFLAQNSSLKRGEGFIRMGTTQMRLFRSHYEQMYAKRYQNHKFSGDINISFTRDNVVTQLNVIRKKIDRENLPSSSKAKEIERIIEIKVKELEKYNSIGAIKRGEDYMDQMSMMRIAQFNLMGGGTSYEDRSITTLRKNLKNITKTYYDEDYYFLLEKKAEKINVFIKNVGTSYLKDVKLILKLPKHENLLLAEELPKKPNNKYPVINSGYPFVEEFTEHYEISENLGDLKQHLLVKAFSQPLRMFFSSKDVSDFCLDIEAELFAVNLDEPIRKNIRICVTTDQSLEDIS